MILQIIIIVLIIISIVLQYKMHKNKLFGSQKVKNGVILDSCTLIDGRILELAKIGFLPDIIVLFLYPLPQNILATLFESISFPKSFRCTPSKVILEES